MKKIILSMFSIIACQSLFAQTDEPKSDQIKVTQVKNSQISDQLRQLFNRLSVNGEKVSNHTGIAFFGASNFNFEVLYKSEKQDEREVAYSVSLVDENTKAMYSFTAYYNNGVFSNPMLIKAFPDRSAITYYSLEENKSIDIIKSGDVFNSSINDVDFGAGAIGREFGCGQCVSNCIADAYTNHGWASVWAFVQSIFVPATGAAIALGCTARCCMSTN